MIVYPNIYLSAWLSPLRMYNMWPEIIFGCDIPDIPERETVKRLISLHPGLSFLPPPCVCCQTLSLITVMGLLPCSVPHCSTGVPVRPPLSFAASPCQPYAGRMPKDFSRTCWASSGRQQIWGASGTTCAFPQLIRWRHLWPGATGQTSSAEVSLRGTLAGWGSVFWSWRSESVPSQEKGAPWEEGDLYTSGFTIKWGAFCSPPCL